MRTVVVSFIFGIAGFCTSASADGIDGRTLNRHGLSAAEIKAMPICERPQRIGHWYGRLYRWTRCGRSLFPGR